MTDTAQKSDAPLPPPPEGTYTISEVTDPELATRIRAALAASDLNHKWLAAHWADLMPQCLGKYLAVANQGAFLADTAEEAKAWIESQQPSDPGSILKYVPRHLRPQIYAHSG